MDNNKALRTSKIQNIRQYIVDAFTEHIFGGNPAAVCVLQEWLPDELMMRIARENNLSETAFIVKGNQAYHLRWFTPGGEIDLCGHATLASAFVLMNFYDPKQEKMIFHTMSGSIAVNRRGDLYEMKFPAYKLTGLAVTDQMEDAIGVRPQEAWMGRDLLCVFNNEAIIHSIKPDLEKVKELDGLLLHITAPAKNVDCVSRSFAPKLCVAEDPVCGSGHCHIVPYWAQQLEKDEITAFQASERGGMLYCRKKEDHVYLSGKAVLFSIAELCLETTG